MLAEAGTDRLRPIAFQSTAMCREVKDARAGPVKEPGLGGMFA
jgi:hypothetical protein